MYYSTQFRQVQNGQTSHAISTNLPLVISDYNSGIYQGEYYKNQRQGIGVFYWFSGQIYIGEWYKDTIEGQGTLYFPYGGNLVGFFSNNKVEGAGILTLQDGSRIAGMWKHGRLQGNFVRFDADKQEWMVISSEAYYCINKQANSNNSYGFLNNCGTQVPGTPTTKVASLIYESIKQQIDTPFYQKMTERVSEETQAAKYYDIVQNQSPQGCQKVSFNEVDRFKIKVQQLDEGIFYHGILRGTRPDGLGIMFNMEGRFSVRGRFANTKLNGPGRVELENGEIYDGVFRNGIINSGFYYSAKFNSYISGTFRGQSDICLDFKGKGYPYKLALDNKQRVFPRKMNYKNTSEELFFLVQRDIKMLKVLDISKYIITNDSQVTTDRQRSQESDKYEDNDGTEQQAEQERQTNQQDTGNQQNNNEKQRQHITSNDFDAAFELFIKEQRLDNNESAALSQQYYSRDFNDNCKNEESQRQKSQRNNKIRQNVTSKELLKQVKSNHNSNNNNNNSSREDQQDQESEKAYVNKTQIHKINMDNLREKSRDHLRRMQLISQEIDKENNFEKTQVQNNQLGAWNASQALYEKNHFQRNNQQKTRNHQLQDMMMVDSGNNEDQGYEHGQLQKESLNHFNTSDLSEAETHLEQQLEPSQTKSYSVVLPRQTQMYGSSQHPASGQREEIQDKMIMDIDQQEILKKITANQQLKLKDGQISLSSSGGTASSQERVSHGARAANQLRFYKN